MLSFIPGIVATAREKLAGLKDAIDDFFVGQAKHGVFNKDGTTNIFPDIGVRSVEVIRDKTVASHPLEINKFTQDNVITEPTVITVTLIAEPGDVKRLYNTLDQLYEADVLLSVMCDNRFYKNMVLQSVPIHRDPSMYDALEVPIVLHEFIYRQARASVMSDPENVQLAQYSDRQKAGLRQPQTVTGQDAINVQAQKTVVPTGGA